jgi:hypothetical protein
MRQFLVCGKISYDAKTQAFLLTVDIKIANEIS